MTIRATDIHSLTEFTRNAKHYIQQVKTNKSPIAITVNGDSQVVIVDAQTYQKMVDDLDTARTCTLLRSNPAVSEISQPFSMIKNNTNSE
jgi:prevent-host-death family protein